MCMGQESNAGYRKLAMGIGSWRGTGKKDGEQEEKWDREMEGGMGGGI